ncbi:BTB/POZ domain-containing protein At4g30940-like [Momordica charantia]|uniref:BTB/POZ domain-containing protein At4g30940-like n=1 Tax=Momordica charantia TaxID=3673 RepID=A0A6J1DFZ3_MOMCH|nr:BTB/POZ domain-containing protein At4g30940-like [Momordica charantia]
MASLRLSVGGKIFETTLATLYKAAADSPLRTILVGCGYLDCNALFIDRDPACFGVLLNLLRTGQLSVPPTIPDNLLFREAHYYGLLDQLRAARHVRLDAGNFKLASSITGRTLLKPNALIRASPNGGCSVANGRVFHVYDWTLQQLPTANLDYMKIVGMEWCDSQNILISGCNNSYQNTGGGGIGLFNPRTAQLKYKFKFTSHEGGDDNDQFSCVTPGNLAVDSSNKMMYCCCKDESYGKQMSGIGAWDITTGQKIGFSCDLGVDAFKLQWLPIRNCLMVAISCSHQCNNNFISIMDPRVKDVHLGCWERGRSYHLKHEGKLVDAVGIEERNCVCVMKKNGRFGFVDLRMQLGSDHEEELFPFVEDQRLRCNSDDDEGPNLGWHGGSLFCSIRNIIVCIVGLDLNGNWVLKLNPNMEEDASMAFLLEGTPYFHFILLHKDVGIMRISMRLMYGRHHHHP